MFKLLLTKFQFMARCVILCVMAISSQFCKSSYSRPPPWFPFCTAHSPVLENTTKCSVSFQLVHTTIPNYNWMTRISAHTPSWNFKSFYAAWSFSNFFLSSQYRAVQKENHGPWQTLYSNSSYFTGIYVENVNRSSIKRKTTHDLKELSRVNYLSLLE